MQYCMLQFLTIIPKPVIHIGLMSCLLNISGIIAFALYGPYMNYTLGISPAQFGFIEGIVEFISWGTRILSGVLSDLFARRKLFLIIALVLMLISRLFVAYSTIFVILFIIGRIIDRIGNGIQASPREALVGDYTHDKIRAACYGVRQGLGYAGSAIGSLLLLLWIEDNLNSASDYTNNFLITILPIILALALLILFVTESPSIKKIKKDSSNIRLKEIFSSRVFSHLDKKFWRLMLFVGAFFLSTYSGTFIILYTKLHSGSVGFAMLMQNFFVMIASILVAKLLKKSNRVQVIKVGITLLLLANILLCLGNQGLWFIYIGIALYGCYMGIIYSSILYLIAEFVSIKMRASAFGIYYLLSGVVVFISNSIYGQICEHFSYLHMFIISGLIAAIALLSLSAIVKENKI